MDMKTYHCMDPNENPFLRWGEHQKKSMEEQEDLVQKFKNNPDSFFQSIIPPTKPKNK